MKSMIHRANTRGHADHGWLKTYHTFSFADYYDPSRIHFGALRVLNDDTVAAGKGFGTHPHDNMEIVSIPLSGALAHRDSMGSAETISVGEIQVMSAGTGITHSEFNANAEEPVKFLQIWVLTDQKGHTPRYETVALAPAVPDCLRMIVAPQGADEGQKVGWLHQQAWFYTVDLGADREVEYPLHGTKNGVYVFALEGCAEVAGEVLERRDGMGVWDTDRLTVKACEPSQLLLIEVPM